MKSRILSHMTIEDNSMRMTNCICLVTISIAVCHIKESDIEHACNEIMQIH